MSLFDRFKSAASINNKGNELSKQGKYEEAIQYYEKALKLDPKLVEAWFNKGLALKNLENYKEALKCFENVLKTDPECEKAKKLAEETKEILDKNNENIEDINADFNQDEKIEEKIENPEELEDIKVDTSETAVNEVDKVEKKPKISKFLKFQLKMLNKSLDLDPLYAGTWYDKGVLLSEMGENDEALKCFNTVLAIDPEFKEAKKSKNDLLSKNKDLIDNDIIYINLNETSDKQEELSKPKVSRFTKLQLKMLNKSLDMDPLHADTWYDKGIILKEIKEYGEALQCFEKALTLKPEHKKALKAKEEVLKLIEN